MIQNIIVAFILFAALTYVGLNVYHSVKPSSKPQSPCGGCSGCELMNLKNSCGTTSGAKKKSYSKRFIEAKKKREGFEAFPLIKFKQP